MAKAGPLRKAGRKSGAKAEKPVKIAGKNGSLVASRSTPVKQASAKRVGEPGGESHRKPVAARIARGAKVGGASSRPALEPAVAPEPPPPLPAPIASFTF